MDYIGPRSITYLAQHPPALHTGEEATSAAAWRAGRVAWDLLS